MTHIYRNSKLGDSLVEALAEMVDSHKISGHLASEVLEKVRPPGGARAARHTPWPSSPALCRIPPQFDEAMADALERKVSAKANFRSKLQVYRYIDNVSSLCLLQRRPTGGRHVSACLPDCLPCIVSLPACPGGSRTHTARRRRSPPPPPPPHPPSPSPTRPATLRCGPL